MTRRISDCNTPHEAAIAIPPKPPTPEMAAKAKFIDKTYHWKNAGIRSGDQRSSK